LADVAAVQPEFTFENVTGDIVGFFCPEYVKGLNVTNLHLHFLTGDRRGGGHLLDFEMKSGKMERDIYLIINCYYLKGVIFFLEISHRIVQKNWKKLKIK
jgi:alpha-acetolactate decarboxylase